MGCDQFMTVADTDHLHGKHGFWTCIVVVLRQDKRDERLRRGWLTHSVYSIVDLVSH